MTHEREEPPKPLGDATKLLHRMRSGDSAAENDLLKLLYGDLRRRAENCMRHQPSGHTLQPTALINEAYLKVAKRTRSWQGREHFLAVAATAMRQILVDHARAANSARRPQFDQGATVSDLPTFHAQFEDRALDILALNEALERLAEFDAEMARAVELRFFSGMTSAEAARQIGISRRTIDRKWPTTVAWLHREVT